MATASSVNRRSESGVRSWVPYVVKTSSRGWVRRPTRKRPIQARCFPGFPSEAPPGQGAHERSDHGAEPHGVGDPAVVQELAHGPRVVHDDVEVGQHACDRTPGESAPAEGAAVECLAERRPEKALGDRFHDAHHVPALTGAGSGLYLT